MYIEAIYVVRKVASRSISKLKILGFTCALTFHCEQESEAIQIRTFSGCCHNSSHAALLANFYKTI